MKIRSQNKNGDGGEYYGIEEYIPCGHKEITKVLQIFGRPSQIRDRQDFFKGLK